MKKKIPFIILILFIVLSVIYFYLKIQYLSSISYITNETLIPKIVDENFIFDNQQGLSSSRSFEVTKKEKEALFKNITNIKSICSEFNCNYTYLKPAYSIKLIKKFLAFDVKFEGLVTVNKKSDQVVYIIDGKISMPSLSNNFKEPVKLSGKIIFDYLRKGYPRAIIRKANLVSPYFTKIKSHPFRSGFEYAAMRMEERIFKKLLNNF